MIQNEPMTPDEIAARSVDAVATAIGRLCAKLGYPSEAVAEGAIKGAAAVMLASGDSPADVARVLRQFADALGELDCPRKVH